MSPLDLIIYADISSHTVDLPFLSCFTANATSDFRGMSSSSFSFSSGVSLDLPGSLSAVLAPVLPYFMNKPSQFSFLLVKMSSFSVSCFLLHL